MFPTAELQLYFGDLRDVGGNGLVNTSVELPIHLGVIKIILSPPRPINTAKTKVLRPPQHLDQQINPTSTTAVRLQKGLLCCQICRSD